MRKTIRSPLFRTAMIVGALTALSACAAPFQANVARFQQLPPAQGQTFTIEARDPTLAGGLEFDHYAQMVAAELERVGYHRAARGDESDLTVKLAYGVDEGRERIRRDAGFGDSFWGGRGFGGGWYHHGFGARPIIIRTRHGYRYAHGFYDPFLFGGYGDDGISSYTIYTSGLDVLIERRGTGERLFEGSAEAVSRDNDLTRLVPNLIEAMFTDFPGNSGERVRITVAPERE